jgi:biotin operon repressor
MQVGQMESSPAYQRIAPRAIVLHQLGLSQAAIGRRLGVSDKTIAKAIRWRVEQLGPGME